MPILAMFYGIVVRMYFFDDKQHHVPHVHAECSGDDAVFSILTGDVLAGKSLPGRRGSCRPGSRYTATSCWPIGSSPSTARRSSASTR